MSQAFINDLVTLYTERGSEHHGEAVSQITHARECAHFARSEGAADSLVIAALLHDIGHMLHKQGEDAAARGIDTMHERIGSGFLARAFPPSVTEPVALHVSAKRYSATVDPSYQALLSPASLRSFHLQGGVMNAQEIETFLAHPYNADAQRLRAWDEMGKDPHLEIAPFESYVPMMQGLIA